MTEIVEPNSALINKGTTPGDKPVREDIIFGIDIAKGSLHSKEKPEYAVAILRNGDIEHHRMVSFHKFLRMVLMEKPAIIAVDNIYELVCDKRDLISFLRRLPASTKLVQVTGGEKLMPLTKLAREQGLSFDRFDPGAEALICARLAQMGIGYEVSAFEDKTLIKVSRARSPGRGGWSQNRYRRKIHGYVRQKARDVEDHLNEQSKTSGFTFSQNITERFGGYSKAEFLAEAPKSQLHIGSGKYGDVQVSVKSIERDTLVFKPLKKKKRDYIIVGIDPGTTTAIAILTLDGELRMVHSSRTISIPQVIEMIAEQGRPLVIASDVFPTPNAVEKIRRAFNAVSSSPFEVLSAQSKIEFATPYGYSNNHERDAIAAAVSFLRKNKNKLEQIRKKIPPGIDAGEVIAQVVKGKSMESVISGLTNPGIEETRTYEVSEKRDDETFQLRGSIRKYEEIIDEMKDQQEFFKKELALKDSKILELEELIKKQRSEVYKKLKKDRTIQIKDMDIQRLQDKISEKNKRISDLNERIHKLKRVRRLEISGRVLPVKIIFSFTKDSILKTQETVGIKKDDIILLKDASGGGTMTAKIVADLGVRALIVCNEMSHAAEEEFFNLGVPVLRAQDINVQFDPTDDLAVINPEDINKAIELWDRKAQERRMSAKEEWLKSLVDEYRSERRRELKE
jgi:predicted RNase H-like nuclease (RuvC/YqgF family)